MFDYLLGAGIFVLVMAGVAQAANSLDAFFDARYRRELYLTAKAKRELLEKAGDPEWEPVEDEEQSG